MNVGLRLKKKKHKNGEFQVEWSLDIPLAGKLCVTGNVEGFRN